MESAPRHRKRLTSAFVVALVLPLLVAACTSSSVDVTAPTASKCTVTATSSIAMAPAAGASATVSVDTTRDCTWSASSDATWITLASTSAGQGSGSIDVRIGANPNPAPRDGLIVVNDHNVTISQAAAPCTFAVSPTNAAVNAGGGSVTVQVSTLGGCTWSTSSGASWLTVAGGANGAGAATISAAANSGAARSGTATIAGQAVTVTQAAAVAAPPTTPTTPACSYSLSPASAQAGAAAALFSVSLNAAAGCAWTAKSNAPWISVTSAESGSGPATVVLSVLANTGSARTGTATIGGQVLSVSQAAGAAAPPPPPPCSYTISPTHVSVAQKGGPGNVNVTAGPGCAWTAMAHDAWITVTSGASGTGNGTVKYTVDANNDKSRTGDIAIAGQTFTISQAGKN